MLGEADERTEAPHVCVCAEMGSTENRCDIVLGEQLTGVVA